VLTDLYVKAGNIERTSSPDGRWSVWGSDLLDEPVRQWAGLESLNPQLGSGLAASLNDDGFTFAEIADLIDGGTP
jgi:hypothetical protein